MAIADHHTAVANFLSGHGFEIPDGPTLPPLDVAERDVTALALAVSQLAESLGLECGISITRSLLPKARGMVEIRARLALLHAATALAAVELGIPAAHLTSDTSSEKGFAALFIRARRMASQVT